MIHGLILEFTFFIHLKYKSLFFSFSFIYKESQTSIGRSFCGHCAKNRSAHSSLKLIKLVTTNQSSRLYFKRTRLVLQQQQQRKLCCLWYDHKRPSNLWVASAPRKQSIIWHRVGQKWKCVATCPSMTWKYFTLFVP